MGPEPKKLTSNDCEIDLSEKERKLFTIFILSIRTRTPEFFKGFLEKTNIMLNYKLTQRDKKFDEIAKENKFKFNNILEYAEETHPGILENYGHDVYAEAIQTKEHIEYILNMKWRFFDIKTTETNLLTSDRPLIFDGEISKGNLKIALSISPRKIFIASTENDYIFGIKNINKLKFIQKINKLTIEQANKKAFALDNTTYNKKFFQKNLGKTYNKIMPFANNS